MIIRLISCLSICGFLAAVSSFAQTNPDPQLVSKAEAGNLAAETELGQFFQANEEYARAATWYKRAAEQGDAKAQVELGALYQVGWGVPPDDERAASWFRKAAEQGSAEGAMYLGALYERGDGVTKDHAEAVRWYRKAADQGLEPAEVFLAHLYSSPQKDIQDFTQAATWCQKAADRGDPEAQIMLGHLYDTGRGVRRDGRRAEYWYQRAVEHDSAYYSAHHSCYDSLCYTLFTHQYAIKGDAKRQELLGSDYEQQKDFEQAAIWYRKAACKETIRPSLALGCFIKRAKVCQKMMRKQRAGYRQLLRRGTC
jgi:TPR repeat protein